jgi:hypothetical protein
MAPLAVSEFLAGFPHHSLEAYLPELVRAGQRVAVCDQIGRSQTDQDHCKAGCDGIGLARHQPTPIKFWMPVAIIFWQPFTWINRKQA